MDAMQSNHRHQKHVNATGKNTTFARHFKFAIEHISFAKSYKIIAHCPRIGRMVPIRSPTTLTLRASPSIAVTTSPPPPPPFPNSSFPITFLASGGWPLWACIAACGSASQIIEKRTRMGIYLSAPLLATLLSLLLSSLGLIPSTSPIYDTIWTYIMPLAASLYLLESDISTLLSKTFADSLIAFFNGALGTVVGTILAYALVGKYLDPVHGPKVAAALCASYIGGSVNFAAVAGILGLSSGSTLAAAMTSDNLAMAAYIAVLMSIPAVYTSTTTYSHASDSKPNELGNATTTTAAAAATGESLGLSIAAAAISCAWGNAAACALGFPSGGLAFTALISSGIATASGLLMRWRARRRLYSATTDITDTIGTTVADPTCMKQTVFLFQGAEHLGGALMMMFFATIGAAAGSFSTLFQSPHTIWLLLFIFILLSVQLTIALALGKVFRISTPVVLIAANANVGGPATAAAMAGAKGWKELVQPAVLTGALGYAIANAVGVAMGMWFLTWKF